MIILYNSHYIQQKMSNFNGKQSFSNFPKAVVNKLWTLQQQSIRSNRSTESSGILRLNVGQSQLCNIRRVCFTNQRWTFFPSTFNFSFPFSLLSSFVLKEIPLANPSGTRARLPLISSFSFLLYFLCLHKLTKRFQMFQVNQVKKNKKSAESS